MKINLLDIDTEQFHVDSHSFNGEVVYSISKRIEIDRQKEWQEFLVLHPELVKKNEPITASVSNNNTVTNEAVKIKYIDEMWHRHRAKGDKHERNR
jgi:hypothetical protein